MMIKGLYIHIPFCKQICSYCDFYKQVAKQKTISRYIDTLKKEVDFYKDKFHKLETIYIGGGTPSSIQLDILEKLLKKISSLIDLDSIKEFTIEANPNDVTDDFVKLIKKYKINRISIGVQTTDNNLLEILNRNHTKSDIIKGLTVLTENEFDNYNLDFIYGIPYQTLDYVKKDLEFIRKYKPKHISYYSLILEKKTVLHYQILQGMIKEPDEDKVADLSDYVKDALKELGYNHYETSNYCIDGYSSKHNLIYWDLDEYLGLGLGAASQYNNKRYLNPTSITKYLMDFKQVKEESFSAKEEFLIMGLRKLKGISLNEFNQRFEQNVFDVFPHLEKHILNNLLVVAGDRLHLTEKGSDLANQVYMDII